MKAGRTEILVWLKWFSTESTLQRRITSTYTLPHIAKGLTWENSKRRRWRECSQCPLSNLHRRNGPLCFFVLEKDGTLSFSPDYDKFMAVWSYDSYPMLWANVLTGLEKQWWFQHWTLIATISRWTLPRKIRIELNFHLVSASFISLACPSDWSMPQRCSTSNGRPTDKSQKAVVPRPFRRLVLFFPTTDEHTEHFRQVFMRWYEVSTT